MTSRRRPTTPQHHCVRPTKMAAGRGGSVTPFSVTRTSPPSAPQGGSGGRCCPVLSSPIPRGRLPAAGGASGRGLLRAGALRQVQLLTGQVLRESAAGRPVPCANTATSTATATPRPCRIHGAAELLQLQEAKAEVEALVGRPRMPSSAPGPGVW